MIFHLILSLKAPNYSNTNDNSVAFIQTNKLNFVLVVKKSFDIKEDVIQNLSRVECIQQPILSLKKCLGFIYENYYQQDIIYNNKLPIC